MPEPQPRKQRGIAPLLAALSALGPFSIDAYLPSFPAIGASLNATPLQVQQTLSAYLLAFAGMALWHGALADRYGRRQVILAALGLFALASLGCLCAGSIGELWLWRTLQGVTAGAGIVVSRAIVRDLYDGAEAQRLMAQIMMLFALAPAIAPLLGGWLQVTWGWRAVFAFLVLLTVGLALACWYLLPETLPPEKRQPLHPAYLLGAYRGVLGTSAFLAATAALACNFAAFFLYVLSAPVFVMRHLGLPETAFLWLFAPATAGLICGSALAARIAGRCSQPRTLMFGYALMGGAATVNLLYSHFFPPALPWSIVPIFIYTSGMALASPSLTLHALDPFPQQRGLAASCQTFLQAGFNGLTAALLAPALWATPQTLSLGMAGLLGLGAAATLLGSRWRQRGG